MKYLIFLFLLTACIFNQEKTAEPPVIQNPVIVLGSYRADIYNNYTFFDDEGQIHVVSLSAYVLLTLNSSTYSQVNYIDASIDGQPYIDSATVTGIYKQQPGQICFDTGSGMDCETVKSITSESFSMQITDTELIEMFGREWIVFIKI